MQDKYKLRDRISTVFDQLPGLPLEHSEETSEFVDFATAFQRSKSKSKLLDPHTLFALESTVNTRSANRTVVHDLVLANNILKQEVASIKQEVASIKQEVASLKRIIKQKNHEQIQNQSTIKANQLKLFFGLSEKIEHPKNKLQSIFSEYDIDENSLEMLEDVRDRYE